MEGTRLPDILSARRTSGFERRQELWRSEFDHLSGGIPNIEVKKDA